MLRKNNNNLKTILKEWNNFLDETKKFDSLFNTIDDMLLENKRQRKIQNPTGTKNFGIQLSALLLATLGVTGFMYKKTLDVKDFNNRKPAVSSNTSYNNNNTNFSKEEQKVLSAANRIDKITARNLNDIKSELEKRELSYEEWERLVRSIIDSGHFSADELAAIGIDERSSDFLDTYLEKLPHLLKICERKISEENFTKDTLSSFGVDQESFQETFLTGEADQFVESMTNLFVSDNPDYVEKSIQTLFSTLNNDQIDPEIKDIINALGTAINNPERLEDPSFIKMVRSPDAQSLLKDYAKKISDQLKSYQDSDY